jgi:hypothetical protein
MKTSVTEIFISDGVMYLPTRKLSRLFMQIKLRGNDGTF